MSGNEVGPKQSTSSLCKLEKMRRHRFNRRKCRSISFSLLCISRLWVPQFDTGDQQRDHGANPRSKASRQVSLPRRRSPSTSTNPSVADYDGSAIYALPAHRWPGHGPTRTLGQLEHRRQPHEPWCTSRFGTCPRIGARFLSAPVPSGRTLTTVLSGATAPSLERPICSRCRCSKTRSGTPPFNQQFILL